MTEKEALSTVRALKLALEALQNPWKAGPDGVAEAITAIKEALMSGTDGAQPWEKFCDSNCVWTDHHPDCKMAEQEPDYYGLTADHLWMSISKDHYDRLKPEYRMTCYTTPPQRKPLTLDELWRVFTRSGLSQFHQRDSVVEYKYQKCIEEFARAIEAAHGIIAPTELKGEA